MMVDKEVEFESCIISLLNIREWSRKWMDVMNTVDDISTLQLIEIQVSASMVFYNPVIIGNDVGRQQNI